MPVQLTIVGIDAAAKARRTGEAIVQRTSELLAAAGMAPYTASHIEVLGAESCYGPHASASASDVREVVLRLSASHPRKEALDLAGARDRAGRHLLGTRHHRSRWRTRVGVAIDPAIRVSVAQEMVTPQVQMAGGETLALAPAAAPGPAERHTAVRAAQAPEVAPAGAPATATPDGTASATITVPLIRLAWARSGDKGDISNIGVIARRTDLLPLLRAQLTEAAVATYLAHLVQGHASRATRCPAFMRSTLSANRRSMAAAWPRCATTRWARAWRRSFWPCPSPCQPILAGN